MLADIADATIEAVGRNHFKGPIPPTPRDTGHESDRSAKESESSNSRADERTSSVQTVSGSPAKVLHTKPDCTELLNSLGYRLTPRGTGWILKEPLGGTVKIAGLPALLGYSRPQQFQRNSSFLFAVKRVTPNHSFKRSAIGRPPGPGRQHAVHFRQLVSGVQPSSPA